MILAQFPEKKNKILDEKACKKRQVIVVLMNIINDTIGKEKKKSG